MKFPKISDSTRLKRLQPPGGKVRMVLDTDTYNEIDDQFAVVQALLSPDELHLDAIYAAPFLNDRSISPGDGMLKSYEEILRLLSRLNVPADGFVFKGSTRFLEESIKPVESDAVHDLLMKADSINPEDDGPLYVVAIGAITNVASAILLCPDIINKIVVVWLGGHAHYWPHTWEFNLQQDIIASKLIFDCGLPLVQIPCLGVTSHLHTTWPEMEAHVKGKGVMGNYLAEIFYDYSNDHFAWSKVIWDIAAISWLINSEWVSTDLVHSPVLTDQKTWSTDHSRHLIRVATQVNRDLIFRDLFTKLEKFSLNQ